MNPTGVPPPPLSDGTPVGPLSSNHVRAVLDRLLLSESGVGFDSRGSLSFLVARRVRNVPSSLGRTTGI